MSDLPTGQPAYDKESARKRVGEWLQRRVPEVAEAEVDVGPFEAAFGTILGVLAGGIAGLVPAVVFRSAVLLPVGLLLGGVGGGVLFALLRRRLTIRGQRLVSVGALLLAILVLCFSCGLVQTIAMSQKTTQIAELERRSDELGLAPFQEPITTTGGFPTQMVVGFLILGGLGSVVVAIVGGVILVILKRR